ncbi:MAG: asparagine synthetase B family protein, partial [Pseudolabrys sp.]|nr:asparagine synthetase B family protein [Pseudolabrys sp.]
RCLGAFAFAHWDAQARRLTLGRDCLGHRSLLFHRAGDTIIFSNRLPALLAMPQVPREVDTLGLGNLLALNRTGSRRTAYRGIERTPSRSLLTIDRAGIREDYYWSPAFDAAPLYRRDEDYVARARELFGQAVDAVIAGQNDFAIPLSGGLDSSAIAATVARTGRASRIVCYTTLPPPDLDLPISPRRYRDERDKVEVLARMYPALDINFLPWQMSHPFASDPAAFFDRALLPNYAPSSLGMMGVMQGALSRHALILSGAGGNNGLSWTGNFSLLALLALLRAGAWGSFARELPLVARHSGQSIGRTVLSDVLKPARPMALKRLWHRLRGRDPDGVAQYSALNPDFVAQMDLARFSRTQGFDPWFEPSGWSSARLRARLLFDRARIDGDNREWVTDTCGFTTRDPHADRRVLEFALAVPEPLYRRNGVPRSFARAVFADRLPPEILRETRRGVNNLPWFRTLNPQRARIAAEIEWMETSVTARGLIDVPRLKRLLDEWPKDERAAQSRVTDYQLMLARAVHIGSFIRWVEQAKQGITGGG